MRNAEFLHPFCLVLLWVALPLHGAEDWTFQQIDNMPASRVAVGAVAPVLDGNLYVIGGECTSCGYDTPPTVQRFDPASGWDLPAGLPMGIFTPGAAAACGRIYVTGGQRCGCQGIGDLFEYDPGTNSWADVSRFPGLGPSPSCGETPGAIAAIGEKVYVLFRPGGVRQMRSYDCVTGSWEGPWAQPPHLPGRTVACGGNLYVASNDGSGFLSTYDPVTDAWTDIPGLPSSVGVVVPIECDCKLYFFGVCDREFDAFDPTTGLWEHIADPTFPPLPRDGGWAGGSIGNDIYLAAARICPDLRTCGTNVFEVGIRENHAPSCDAGPDIRASCDGVAMGAEASDPDCGSTLTYSWSSSCPGTRFAPGDDVLDPLVIFGSSCGVSCALTLRVRDEEGAQCSDTVQVDVDDATPPVVTPRSNDFQCL